MQKGLKCVRGTIPHEECRACAADPLHPCHLTPDFLESIRDDPTHRHANPDIASPSSLVDCDRKYGLLSETDHYTDVEQAYAATRGTLLHAGASQLDYPGAVDVLREVDMVAYVDTSKGRKKVMGTADLIVIKEIRDGVAYAKVVDYKTKGEVSHGDVAPNPDHVMQLNQYKWLIERGRFIKNKKPYRYKHPIVVDELELLYLGFNKPRRFTSAGELHAPGKFLDRKTGEREDLTLSPIPILDTDVTQDWITKRVEQRQEAIHGTLPPPLSGDATWRCRYCPVQQVCFEKAARGK